MTPAAKLNDPDYQCSAYYRMAGPLKIIRDVLGGTPSMRAAREEYLPRHPKEHATREYPARVNRSVFFNATKKTSGALVGMVCKNEPQLKESVPDEIKLHWENIDLAGSHGAVFIKEVFTDAINDGHAFILVDMAKPVPPSLTRREEMGRRPYWLRYKKDQAYNWFSDRVNGEEILTQITFRECSSERDGRYGEKEVVRYRVIYLPLQDPGLDADGNQVRPPIYGPMEWELYQEDKDAPAENKFRLVDGGKTKLTRIPLAVIYGKRTGFLESEPLLLDLAYLNIDWWQQNSDYRSQLNKLVPILVRVGLPEELRGKEEFSLGPGALADLPSVPKDQTTPSLTYVSHDGAALGATRQALLDIEQRMAMAGLSILTQRTDSNITATEKRMDQDERTSELATAGRSLRDGVELCFGFHAQYMGIADRMGDGGALDMGVADDDLMLDAQDLAVANNMVSQGRLTIETLHLLASKRWRLDLAGEIEALKKVKPPAPVIPPPPNGPPNGNGANTDQEEMMQ